MLKHLIDTRVGASAVSGGEVEHFWGILLVSKHGGAEHRATLQPDAL